ncbi:LytTR family DNA-binding domain-containing protein [Desulfovibrio sp. OttesenSCG-928-G11]|nr:LytTR family DNA-binding domain-containing protein [Desulfovibrio sp. OttesenSCG-928-G11]
MNRAALSIAVVDDEAESLEELRAVLEKTLAGESYSLSLFESAAALHSGMQASFFDLVFLDILMPGKSGLELAVEIYNSDQNCLVAFISFSPDFALQGYGINTVGYLLKPPTEERMRKVLEICRKRWASQGSPHSTGRESEVVLSSARETIRLNAGELVFLESDNKTVTLYTDNGPLLWRGTMKELMRRLPEGFIRVHQSFAVNRERVFRLRSGKMLMDNGREVPVSRAYRKSVSQDFLGFLAAKAKEGS